MDGASGRLTLCSASEGSLSFVSQKRISFRSYMGFFFGDTKTKFICTVKMTDSQKTSE